MRLWRLSNREKCLEYERKWREQNPEANRARSANRRAREFNSEGFHTKEDITLLIKSQTSCVGCEREFSEDLPYTLDHKVPLMKGGSNWPSNLQLLCRPCNSSKMDKDYEEWVRSFNG